MQQGKVITYALRQLKDFEIRYLTYGLELVAIVFAPKIWRHYLWCLHQSQKLLVIFHLEIVEYKTEEMSWVSEGL